MALNNYTGKYTGAGQTIVVIGKGISNNYTNNNVVYSYDFADNDSNAINISSNHGGQVANVAQQIASDVKIIHLKVFSDGSSGAYSSDIEAAFQWVANNADAYGITAVNMSLGFNNVQTSTTWQGSDEYQTLDDKGVIVTVSSGNNNEYYDVDGVNLLSSSESVLSVSAVNKDGDFTTFSQNHENLTDIAALGEDIKVIDNKGDSHLISGTSFSAPIIAAAAAVIQEAATVLLGHKITDEEFTDLIQKTGDKITGYALHSEGLNNTSNTPLNNPGMSQALELSTGGNSITKAQNIGALVTGTKVLQSSVTKITDDKDFYKFELTADSQVDFLLSKLSADVDLNLYDASGSLLHEGWDWGNVDIAYTKTLTTGVYFVEVDYYDGSNSGVTSTYDLSLTSSNATTTPDTDNTIAGAKDIGVLTTGVKVLQDSVTKMTDDKDFYKFELTANSQVGFSLSKLSADVDLNLYDASGSLLHEGWDWGNVDIAYTKTLTTGVYFVEVDYYDSGNPDVTSTYDLSLTSSIATAPLDTDGSIAGAKDIGILTTGVKVLQDSVTKTTDDKDFYKFELIADGKVDFLLSKLSADVDLNLYGSSGNLIHSGWDLGNVDIAYTKTLDKGVYFVEVEYYIDGGDSSEVTSTYDLSLDLAAGDVIIVPIPTLDTDNTIATAQNIGTLAIGTKVLQDSVTKTTDDKDFYKFELTANGKVDFLLSKLSADVVLNLYASDGSSIHEGSAPDSNDVAYTETLATGVYFVEVDYKDYEDGFNQKITTTSYDLSLSLSNTNTLTPAPTPDTDGTIATAQNIGVLAMGTKVLQDSVTKTTDDKDFYKFELTAKGKVDFLLSKLSTDVELNLYASDGSVIHKGWVSGTNDVAYAKTLAAGVYFVAVDYKDYDNDFNQDMSTTSYDLSLTLGGAPAPDTDNTIATAQNIGVLEVGTKVLQDSVTKTTDDKDFYKFELTTDSKVDFLLSELSSDVMLNFYASDGSSIHEGWSWDNNNVAYTKILTTGVYFVAVDYRDYADGFNQNVITTSYDLSLTLGEAPESDTDNTIATAENIGVLTMDTKVLQDSVTKTTDDKDFYKFELTTDSKVNFSLSDLSANVDLSLYNEDGGLVRSGEALNDSDISYTQLLAAGTYYAEVDYVDYSDNKETSTTYDLSLKASELKIPDDATGYTQINLANAVAYLETHQSMYNDQIIL